MDQATIQLKTLITACNAGGLQFHNPHKNISERIYSSTNYKIISDLDDPRIEQLTMHGIENHLIKTYLAILLMRTVRDFTDTDSGVYGSHCAALYIIELSRKERSLRRRIRKQIRRR